MCVVMLPARQRTWDSQVMGSSPDWAPLRSGLAKATYTSVPLSVTKQYTCSLVQAKVAGDLWLVK